MQKLAAALLVVVSLIVVTAGSAMNEQAKGTDGTWLAVGMEQNGMKLPGEEVEKMKIKLVLKGDDFSVTMDGTVIDKGTSKVDAQKKPNAVDIMSTEGPGKGKTILGIVEVDGDTMKACYDIEGKGRPTAFASKEGSGHTLILYKREMVKK